MSRRWRIRAALGLLIAVHLAAFGAGWLAPYPYAEQHREHPYAAPAAHFLLGTDGYGRDVFSRLLFGARISFVIGLGAATLSLTLGLAVGVTAGYFGGWPDRILMRSGELFLSLPWLYLLLAVRGLLPLGAGTGTMVLLLTATIGAVGWVRPARLIRGVVLSGKERGYVEAARGFGASDWYLIRRHLLPLTAGVVATQATVLIPQDILAEITLSFLGLGIGEPVPSWGNMLAEARQYPNLVAHPWLLSPALALVPVLLAYLVLTDNWVTYGGYRAALRVAKHADMNPLLDVSQSGSS
jgi:peptide/nickel transport system permease protein